MLAWGILATAIFIQHLQMAATITIAVRKSWNWKQLVLVWPSSVSLHLISDCGNRSFYIQTNPCHVAMNCVLLPTLIRISLYKQDTKLAHFCCRNPASGPSMQPHQDRCQNGRESYSSESTNTWWFVLRLLNWYLPLLNWVVFAVVITTVIQSSQQVSNSMPSPTGTIVHAKC